MYSKFNTEEDEGNISPQLPSFVDVVFILLIFFLLLSVVGYGVVESGSQSDGYFTKQQDVSQFPAVQKALKKEINEFLTISLDIDAQGRPTYHIFSSHPFNGVIIETPEEYETIRARIASGQLTFNDAGIESPLTTLESVWGPFNDAEAMSKSLLVLTTMASNLIIQANEKFTYHQILEVMRLFRQYSSVYFEVIENGTSN